MWVLNIVLNYCVVRQYILWRKVWIVIIFRTMLIEILNYLKFVILLYVKMREYSTAWRFMVFNNENEVNYRLHLCKNWTFQILDFKKIYTKCRQIVGKCRQMRQIWDMLFVAIFLIIYDFKWLLRVCRVVLYSMQWYLFQNVHFWLHYVEKWTKMNIFLKLSDLIINASEWFENISGGHLPIFTALLDG